MIISILTPTRERPEKLARFVRSIHETADRPEFVEILAYVDDDDPLLTAYRKLDVRVDEFVVGEEPSVGSMWNILAWRSLGDVFMMGNDDVVMETKGWDTILRQELDHYPDKIYCAWFNDGINGKKHCAFPIVSRVWTVILEHFTPECFHFFYHDTWVFDIAKRIGRLCYIPRVMMRHHHFSKFKKERDATYDRQRRGEKGNVFLLDKPIWKETEEKRRRLAERLKGYMK